MAKRKRKVNIVRLLLVIFIMLLIIAASILLVFALINKEDKKEFSVEDLHINELDYSFAQKLDLDLYSKNYLLIRLNDFKVQYANGNETKFYPASLTKVLTMSAVLDVCKDTNETSSFSNEQRDELIIENASLAYIEPEKDYSIEELLYALILPSGADGAVALENYMNSKGENLVGKMNELCNRLNLSNSHFTNTTGLHDDNLYTSLDDYAKIVINSLLNDESKKILKTTTYTLDDGNYLSSTLASLSERNDGIKVYGGKTGYTEEAGMNIMVLYEVGNRSYLLILSGADGNPYKEGMLNIYDVRKIFDYLYS